MVFPRFMSPDQFPSTSVARAGRVLGRAVLRRCPNCGGSGIFRSYLQPLPFCPSCCLQLDRGEHDFFVGAYTLNLIAAELIVVAGGLAVLLLTWPAVPWTLLTYGLAALVVVVPILTYPWSRQLWLAVDLIFQPPEPRDFRSKPDCG